MVQKKLIADQEIGVNQGTLSIAQRWGWTLFSMFVIAVLVEPAYIAEAQGGMLHRVFYISKYIAAVSVMFLYFIRRPKMNGFLLGCMIFEAVLLLSTFVHSANMIEWVKDGAYVVIFGVFLQVMIELAPEHLLRVLSMVLGTYVNINTFSKLIYPGGLYRNTAGYQNCWFLGYDNIACVIIVVAITVSLFRILLYRGKGMIWDWSVVGGGVWYTFSLNVATAIVAMAGFFLFMILTRFERVRVKIGKAWLIIVGMIGLFLFIQFFFTQENGLLSLIFQILKKNGSFSGRAPLWQKAWSDLGGGKVIFGSGVHSSNEYVLHFGQYWNFHLHCYYLQVIYEGGLIAFGALLGWLLHAARRFDQTRHRYCVMAFPAGLLAILFMWQMEASNNLVRYSIIVLFLLYNAKEFESLGQKYQYRRWRLVFCAPGRRMGEKRIGGNIA